MTNIIIGTRETVPTRIKSDTIITDADMMLNPNTVSNTRSRTELLFAITGGAKLASVAFLKSLASEHCKLTKGGTRVGIV